jgi:hypothetical protein
MRDRYYIMSAQFGTPPPDFNTLFSQVLTNAQELRRQVESNIKPKTDEDRRVVTKYYADLDALIEQAQQARPPTPPDNIEEEAIDRIIQLIGEVFDPFNNLPFISAAYRSNDRRNLADYYNTRKEISGPLFALLYLTVDLRIALSQHHQSQLLRNGLRQEE